jgi:hypothetical protein
MMCKVFEQRLSKKELRKRARGLQLEVYFLANLVYVYDGMLKKAIGETLYQATLRGERREITSQLPEMNGRAKKIYKEVIEHLETGIR